MKTCIYGAGAIGGWIGARLTQAGCTLSAVARGATLAALQRDGLTLISGGQRTCASVQASDDPAALGVQDLVVIAVKAPALPAVAERIGPLLGPQTLVLTAMNGVPWWFLPDHRLESIDPGGRIAAAIPAEHVMGCVVHASCALDAPGVVRHHLGNGLIIGEPSGEITARAKTLQALLAHAGFEATLSPHIQKDIWYKLWGNMTLNPVSALTGATMDIILDDDLLRAFISNVMLEARTIGERIGLPIAQSPEDRHVITRKLGAVKTSMLQDVEAGRPVELDALVGAVRELGQLTHVATPFTDALLGLARVQARRLGLY